MKKKFFKITFSFLFLPFFIVSCASKPEASLEDESQISAPVEEPSESINEIENLEELENPENLDAEAENLTEETDSVNQTDAEAENSNESESANETADESEAEEEFDETFDTEDSEASESESASDDEQKEKQDFENFEEPEVITLEYEEEEPAAEAENEEKIKSEEIDLNYIDLENEDEDEEIQVDSDDDEIEFISDAAETKSDENEDIQVSDEQEDFEEESTEEDIEISRKVTMKLQEYLDISYPGNGWIYMGLTDGSKDLSYFGRKLGTKDTEFTLQAKKAGVKIVHFYRVDPLTGEYIDDYIEITIENEKGSNKTHIQTPEYQPPLPKKAKALVPVTEIKDNSETDTENEAKAENTEEKIKEASLKPEKNDKEDEQKDEEKTESSTSSSSSSNIEKETSENTEKTEEKNKIDTKSLLKEAQVLYNNEDYASADKKIKTFLDYAVSDQDAGLFLQGQILEAKSDIQDIKAAIEAYKTLTRNYPASPYWEEANKKIIYLNRFYLEIR